ncbi:cytochrome P450 [Myxozyma melibiosi]|uniref:sterol 14alpha-demethylase n=1 Tax=Myxozyma melibiosi TaxID=54550 RepID=A0ABR1FCZ5_9ASCO
MPNFELLVSSICVILAGAVVYHFLLLSSEGGIPLVKGKVPVLGVALDFVSGPQKLLHAARQSKGWIFDVYLAGQRMTIVSDPIVGNRAMWANRSLSLMHFVKFLDANVFKYSPRVVNDFEFLQRVAKRLISVMTYKPDMNETADKIREEYLKLVDDSSELARHSGEVVDLYDYCRYNMFYASTVGLFGESFPVQAIYEPFMDFEDNIPKFLKMYPRVFNMKGYNGRQKVLDELGKYFLDTERVRTSAPFVRKMYDTFVEAGYDSYEDLSGYFCSILVAAKSNSVPGAFWLLAEVIRNPPLKAQVERIIADAYVPATGDFDWDSLMANQTLEACFKEMLRLNVNLASGRVALDDTTLKVTTDTLDLKDSSSPPTTTKEYRIKKGSNLLMFYNLVNWDKTLYPDPMTFKPDRFLVDDREHNITHPEWRAFSPWGGGSHICPGRFLAHIEAVAQLTYMLWFYDIVPQEEMPKPKIGDRYGGGVFKPERGYKVKITRRSTPLTASSL